jgi:two-component system phosphate regulon response regulator PhoB
MMRKGSVPTILLIEDEPNIQRLTGYALQTRGYEVVVASDGHEGLDKARSRLPDLILLDMVMPEMGGMEVLKALKEDGRLRDIPVLIVTASAQREDAERALRMGARDYLIKPFHMPTLYEKVEELLPRVAGED